MRTNVNNVSGALINEKQVDLPRFYRHLHKGVNDEIGGNHASKNPTSV